MRESEAPPLVVPYLSPVVLRKELETLVTQDGSDVLGREGLVSSRLGGSGIFDMLCSYFVCVCGCVLTSILYSPSPPLSLSPFLPFSLPLSPSLPPSLSLYGHFQSLSLLELGVVLLSSAAANVPPSPHSLGVHTLQQRAKEGQCDTHLSYT